MELFGDVMEDLKNPKKEFFLRNGELLKRKQIEIWGERAFPIRIFSAQELMKSIQIIDDNGLSKVCIDGRSFMVDSSKSYPEEWVTVEIAIQANIYHRNVLRLPGCCLETRCPVPVYELISYNGTLHDHLCRCREDAEHLRWSDRLRIAAEVADALNYLHTRSSIPIIHRGVVPVHILLDDRLTAKLTGFESSIPKPADTRKDLETSSHVTIGYMDPDYDLTGVVHEQTDVYSLGIVMLLLLTGKHSYHDSCDGPFYTKVERFAAYLKNDPYAEIPCKGAKEQIQAFLHCQGKTDQVEAFCKVALKCTEKEKENRPIMKDVVQALRQIIRNM